MFFKAYLYYLTEPDDRGQRFEQHTEIFFEGDSYEDAVIDTVDWYRGRQEAIPDHFTPLVAVKIYSIHPQRIVDRQLSPNSGLPFYEWKFDAGYPLPEPRVPA